MDWNWFFSSLAQSTAAIVGLFGAFIFTKIITNEQKFNDNNEIIEEFIINAGYLRDTFKPIIQELYDYHGDINARVQEPTFYNLFFNIKSINIRNTLNSYNLYNPNAQKGSGYYNDEGIDKLIEKRNKLQNNLMLLKQTTYKANFYQKIVKANTESSKLINESIHYAKLLFIGGVIIPLLILPAAPIVLRSPSIAEIGFNLIKIILLIFITFIFMKIFNLFKDKNEKMKYDTKYANTLQEYSKLENYSPYLKTYIENKILKEDVLVESL